MLKITAEYAGQCCKCGARHTAGAKIAFEPTAARGKKQFCLNCAGHGLFVPSATEAEIAKLKQRLDEEFSEPQPAPAAPKPHADFFPTPVIPAPTDPLAAAIAAAIEPLIRHKLDESRVLDLIAEHTKPMAHTITVVTPQRPQGIDMGRQHKQFEDLMIMLAARQHTGGRLNIWVGGPGGTGKTTAAEMAAKALGLKFAVMPTQVDCYGFYGVISPGTGKYQGTPAREIWEHGGVLILDDYDGTPADVAIQLNAPFANGHSTFPDGVVHRHADCILIVTANTMGGGATNEYNGRLKQDAAFMDRFVFLDWEIDEELERDTCPVPSWAERVQAVRRTVKRLGIEVLITPRASYYGAALLQAGYPQAKVEKATLRKTMSDEQWRTVCTQS